MYLFFPRPKWWVIDIYDYCPHWFLAVGSVILQQPLQVYRATFWMRKFKANSMKRTLILSNHIGVAKLTLGKLVKRLRRAARPTTKRYINRDGKPAYQGTKRLKASQPLSSILAVQAFKASNQSKGPLDYLGATCTDKYFPNDVLKSPALFG